jgi:hypothetical protein
MSAPLFSNRYLNHKTMNHKEIIFPTAILGFYTTHGIIGAQ